MKTGKTVLKLPLSYKAVNFYKAVNLYKTFNIYKAPDICKAPNIRKILLFLDGCSRAYRVSKVCEDKAGRPVLDTEEVITLLSINVKG